MIWYPFVPRTFLLAVALAGCPNFTLASSFLATVTYPSSVSSDAGGMLDLNAELNYESTRMNAPIAVVMHGYSGSAGKAAEVRNNAQRLRDTGFFVVSVSMRGRDGSDGVRDSGGVEVYDIYDAVEYVKAAFPTLVDPTNISITGYSGGGGNTMSALTKFPDYFRAGSSYFGMSDYGYDAVSGWYFDGADSGHKSQMNSDIGNPALGNPTIEDRYLARASNLASRNNPYSEIHLFVNQNEPTCPPVNDNTYQGNAVAAASFDGEFNKINVHIGGLGQYVDFNHNGINEANELQSWPHGYPSSNQQQAAEAWYLPRLLDGSIPQPVLNLKDDLFVAGFVVTKRFSLWLGDGQNAAGDLNYDLSDNLWTFDLDILSNSTSIQGTLKVDTAALSGKMLAARLNGIVVGQFVGGSAFQQNNFGNNDQLTLTVVGPGDFDCDGDVDGADFVAWQTNFPKPSGATLDQGEANGDGAVDGADFVVWQTHFPTLIAPAATTVPEPTAGELVAMSLMIAFCVVGLAHAVDGT
ncbi:MAG: prolyl oligopeptidase family serine peptidase [Pirellulales bacterium]|nr:prolyl oligopeptidase family serine peptidase [Pirellulales bacterium]